MVGLTVIRFRFHRLNQTMKRLLLLGAGWGLLLASCREITFPEPQPAGVEQLAEIPLGLRGKYVVRDDQSGEKGDTLLIESWGYHFKDSNEKDWLGRGTLSDSLIVKFYQEYYFINFKSGDQWVLRLVKQLPGGDFQFLSIDLKGEEKDKEVVKKLSKKFKVKEIKKNEDTFYQINPTPAQLMVLIKEGYFTGSTLEKKK
jgi:hypothetical protein